MELFCDWVSCSTACATIEAWSAVAWGDPDPESCLLRKVERNRRLEMERLKSRVIKAKAKLKMNVWGS